MAMERAMNGVLKGTTKKRTQKHRRNRNQHYSNLRTIPRSTYMRVHGQYTKVYS